MDWSSGDLIKAVENQGYTRKEGRGKRGTHRVWAKQGKAGELHNTVTVPVDRKRIAEGTMRNILDQLGVTEDTLRSWLAHPSTKREVKTQPAYRKKPTKKS